MFGFIHHRGRYGEFWKRVHSYVGNEVVLSEPALRRLFGYIKSDEDEYRRVVPKSIQREEARYTAITGGDRYSVMIKFSAGLAGYAMLGPKRFADRHGGEIAAQFQHQMGEAKRGQSMEADPKIIEYLIEHNLAAEDFVQAWCDAR